MKILLLDNYDSFTYNLAHLVEKVSPHSVTVVKNDQIRLKEIEYFDSIILSPGPGLPRDAGIMPALLSEYFNRKPILGVCLGLQAIGEHFGGRLKNLATVCHGVATPISVMRSDVLFKDCPSSFLVGRYHSWVIDEQGLPGSLEITATDGNGLIMAARHRQHQICGVQFHPESVLSEYGDTIIRNWLTAATN